MFYFRLSFVHRPATHSRKPNFSSATHTFQVSPVFHGFPPCVHTALRRACSTAPAPPPPAPSIDWADAAGVGCPPPHPGGQGRPVAIQTKSSLDLHPIVRHANTTALYMIRRSGSFERSKKKHDTKDCLLLSCFRGYFISYQTHITLLCWCFKRVCKHNTVTILG